MKDMLVDMVLEWGWTTGAASSQLLGMTMTRGQKMHAPTASHSFSVLGMYVRVIVAEAFKACKQLHEHAEALCHV